ncbi:MAG TPA: DUF4129 domain-containing protein [Candidatus Thermoplasmatota archaeon]|nr:DUF4129 domain-containing protein [Candidatus Thermoplasmatota archaeon]
MSDARLPWAAFVYPAAGAAAGATVGFVVASPARAISTATPWILGLALVGAAGAGAYAGVRALQRRRRSRHGLVPDAPPPTLALAVDLPQIEAGFPDVWGAGEPLDVVVRAPAGAAVVLETDPPQPLEPLGANRFRLRAPEGEVRLRARAALGEARGEAARSVTFALYASEIRHMVEDFRAWAEKNVDGARTTLTARELMEAVAPRAGGDGARALVVLARAYEIVTYGERPADRALYADVVRAFNALERAGLFDPPVPPREAAEAL